MIFIIIGEFGGELEVKNRRDCGLNGTKFAGLNVDFCQGVAANLT